VKAIVTFEVDHVDEPTGLRATLMKDTANAPEGQRRELLESLESLSSRARVPTYRLTGRLRCTGTINQCVLTEGGISGSYTPPISITLPKDVAYREYLAPEAIARRTTQLREAAKKSGLTWTKEREANAREGLVRELSEMEGHTYGSFNGTFRVTSREGECHGPMALYGVEAEIEYTCQNRMGRYMWPETDPYRPGPLRIEKGGAQMGSMYLVRRR
jgi:hypothetical protein